MSKHWYNNGIQEILLEECDEIPDGFIRGRMPNMAGNLNSGRFYVTNDIDELFLPEGSDVPSGYHIGRLPMSNEAKVKNRESHLGKKASEETRKKMSSTRKGKPKSEEWKDKIHQVHQTEEYKKKITSTFANKTKEEIKETQFKIYQTKKKNNSFHISKPEDELYYLLCGQYGENDVIRQYSEARYPFACDFYIPSKDLFIELNASWTHGGRPYNPNDDECIKQLDIWKEKSKNSDFYKQAIYTWTDLDVRKQQCAKQNQLNYITIYSYNQFMNLRKGYHNG